ARDGDARAGRGRALRGARAEVLRHGGPARACPPRGEGADALPRHRRRATPPSRSHLAADLWLPLVPEEPIPGWTNVTNYNYVRLRPGATRADLERGLEGVLRTQVYPASGFDGSFEA